MNIRQLMKSSNDLVNIFILSTFFFTIGYIADGINYFLENDTILLAGNIAALALIWVIYLLFRLKKLKSMPSMALHVCVVTLNLYHGIWSEIMLGTELSILFTVQCLCSCMVPSVLSGMTQRRWAPIVITSGAIALYIIAGIVSDNKEDMLSIVPSLSIVIIGLGFTFAYLIEVNKRMERKNAQAIAEQQNIMQMFDFTPKQWELIKEGRMSRERLSKLLENGNKDAKEKMLHEVKSMILTDETIKNSIRIYHPNLTFREMELACMIAKEMTVTKIAKLRNIKEHSVTAQRSRLRKKLGLTEEQNLNEYLTSIANSDV